MNIEDMKGALPGRKQEEPDLPQALTTVWGETMDPENVWNEYPRPRLVRAGYTMLNGYWHYAITKSSERPTQFDGKILVPFSPESPLSGVGRQLKPEEYLWYERRSAVPVPGTGEHLLLHFEAVDQCVTVYVNGTEAIRHTGGYLPFTADITSLLQKTPACFDSTASAPGEASPDDADSVRYNDDVVLTVCVQDFTDTSFHSRGKQKLQPGGMYYTAQSGIWQSVWMEVVPEEYIEDVLFEPLSDLTGVRVILDVHRFGLKDAESAAQSSDASAEEGNQPVKEADARLPSVHVRVYEPTDAYEAGMSRGNVVLEQEFSSRPFLLSIPGPKLWSPETPWLYPVEIQMGKDRVESYCALRRFEIRKDNAGIPRILLNGRPLFLNGILDQGYWPDGLYTAPTDEALVYDIEEMKALGFNMLRKHAKIECRRWYYHCDRMGMIVWQDMVNGGGNYSAMLLTYLPTGLCVPGPLKKREDVKSSAIGANDAVSSLRPFSKDEESDVTGNPHGAGGIHSGIHMGTNSSAGRFEFARPTLAERLECRITGRRDAAGREEFRRECAETVELLRGYPCVMTWVLFNEGWGQFETKGVTDFVRRLDPEHLIDSASGWFEHKTGDFKSVHNYFRKPDVPKDVRVNVLSEFGGYVYHIDGHSMYRKTYGYHTCTSAEEFEESFFKLMTQDVLPLADHGLCGAVYTQVSDIEEETNGLLTYDRRIRKISEDGARRLRQETAAASQRSAASGV